MATTHGVRNVTVEEIPAVADALAHAFADDPVMEWLFPRERGRADRLRRFFAIDMKEWNLRHGETYTTDDYAGGSIWSPPGKWRLGAWDMLRTFPSMSRILGRRIPTALSGFGMIEKAHPREPHFYLGVLGTHPAHQGKGVGGALMAPVLDRCDREGLGAYLESSKERNVPYYERFGFRVTQELTLPKGPRVWLMWRDPQPQG